MRAAGTHDIVALVTMFGEDGGRSRSHGLSPAVIEAQAGRLGLPIYMERCSWPTYTDRYVHLLAQLRRHDVTHVVFGDIIGEDHRAWNERVCAHHRLIPVMPLWGEPTLALAQEFIARGGRARFVTVRPPILDQSWLGSEFDGSALERLQSRGADPCGEFGEYHTVVTDCPAFESPLRLAPGAHVSSGGCFALDFAVDN